RTSGSPAMHPGSASTRSSIGRSRYEATPTSPCGVTVEVSARITSGLTWRTSTPRSDARTASGWMASSTISVRMPAGSCSSASPTACAPSTRKERESSRNARLCNRMTAETFGFLRLVSTDTPPPDPAPVVRSVRGTGRRRTRASGPGRGVLHGRDERGERRRVVHGQVREDLPIDLHALRLQPIDEPRIRQAVRADGRVDPRDPEAPELTLAVAAIPVRVHPGVTDLLLRDPVTDPPTARVPLGGGEHLAALLLRVDRSFHPGHDVTSRAGA